METKSYLIVDENNEWLSTLKDCTLEELHVEIEVIKKWNDTGNKIFAYVITGEVLSFNSNN